MSRITVKNPLEVVKESFWLAWKACGDPLGMGVYQDRPNATKDDIWAQTFPDYHGSQTEAYGDYVFGRMMKLSLKWDDTSIDIGNLGTNIEYQSWARVYPTYETLVLAAESSLEITSEGGVKEKVETPPGDRLSREKVKEFLLGGGCPPKVADDIMENPRMLDALSKVPEMYDRGMSPMEAFKELLKQTGIKSPPDERLKKMEDKFKEELTKKHAMVTAYVEEAEDLLTRAESIKKCSCELCQTKSVEMAITASVLAVTISKLKGKTKGWNFMLEKFKEITKVSVEEEESK